METAKKTKPNLPLQAFGIYRPVPPQKTGNLITNLKCVRAEIHGRLRPQDDHERLFINYNFGVTFVQMIHISRELAILRRNGFSLSDFYEEIKERAVPFGSAHLPVDLDRFDWFGAQKNKLGFWIKKHSNGFGALREQANLISDVFKNCGINHNMVRYPDHLTLARFGEPWRRAKLDENRRKYIGEQFASGMASVLGGIVLARLVVGSSYDKPLIG